MNEEDQQLQALRTSVEALRQEIQELKLILTGDRIRRITGVVDILEQHRKDIYGDKDIQHVGLKESHEANRKRIELLEGDRMKVIACASAIAFVVALLWPFVKQFFFKS